LLRLQNVSPEHAGPLLLDSLASHRAALTAGGVLIIEPSNSRWRAPWPDQRRGSAPEQM